MMRAVQLMTAQAPPSTTPAPVHFPDGSTGAHDVPDPSCSNSAAFRERRMVAVYQLSRMGGHYNSLMSLGDRRTCSQNRQDLTGSGPAITLR